MAIYLGLLIFSFVVTSLSIVPFINFLYKLKFTYRPKNTGLTSDHTQQSKTLHKMHQWKAGTPVGGGVLIILSVCLMFAVLFPFITRLGLFVKTAHSLKEELNIIFFTFVSFGLIGFYDDIVKTFNISVNTVSHRVKSILMAVLSLLCGLILYQNLGINIINLPWFGVLNIGPGYILLAALVILYFASAVDYTDGLDGLSAGLLLICLLAFWVISVSSFDTPISVFIAIWIGGLLSFLYFNVYPARVWLGNAGAISFGATLAVIALLLGKTTTLFVVGGIYVVEMGSSIVQAISIQILGRKAFPISPLHHWLQISGWPESKIVQRAWLISVVLSIFGLWLSGI